MVGGIQGSQTREITSNESIAFRLDVSRVASATSAVVDPSMQVIDLSNAQDVTMEVTTGAMSISGQKITLKQIQGLKLNRRYRVNVIYSKEGNRFQTVFEVASPY